MTDKFENVAGERPAPTTDPPTERPTIEPSGMEKAITELEALSAKSFKEGRLTAHYTLNTAIEIVKKHMKG